MECRMLGKTGLEISRLGFGSIPIQKIDAEEQEKVAQIRFVLGTNFSRRCNYCAPCAVWVNIPGVFLFARLPGI